MGQFLVNCFFQLKNIFGVLGAKKAGVPAIYSMVEGAGDVFIYNTLKWRMSRRFVCCLLKKSLRHSRKVFFVNRDDRDEYIGYNIVKEEQCDVISGVGVDLDRFS